jgi:uncharacterized membrane protein/predicted DsbA family dithiol-disulfide isomerase
MEEATKRKPPRALATAKPSWADPPRWSPWLLAVVAAIGVALGAISTWVHRRIATSGGAYTSFCNVSETVNCDKVVTSPHGMLLGIPVSVWAIGFYLVLFGLALRSAAPASPRRDRARADAFALAVAGATFSAYLATISIVVLKTICPLCAGLYVVSALSLASAWVLASPLPETVVRLLERWHIVRRRPALATAIAGTVVGVIALSSWLGAQTRLTREQVFRDNPQFYDWYTNQPIVDGVIEGGYSQGPEDAPIQLVEFSDFECPHCAQAHVTLKDLLPRYANQIRFTYHHFPLSSDCNPAIQHKGHEHACRAAVAADCAAQGGRFAPFANLLFANQGALDDKSLRDYAKQVGLDLDAFDQCVASPGPPERLAADVKAAQKMGVRSTPTFFINNRKIEGNMTFANWLFAFAVELDRG